MAQIRILSHRPDAVDYIVYVFENWTRFRTANPNVILQYWYKSQMPKQAQSHVCKFVTHARLHGAIDEQLHTIETPMMAVAHFGEGI